MNQNLRVRRMEVGDLLRAAALEQFFSALV